MRRDSISMIQYFLMCTVLNVFAQNTKYCSTMSPAALKNVPLVGMHHGGEGNNVFELEAYSGSFISFAPGGGISFQFD